MNTPAQPKFKSYLVNAEGGLPMWEEQKVRSLGVVCVTTDDAEFTLAHLVRETATSIQIATYVPTRNDLLSQETGRRYRCQIVSISRSRITSYRMVG